LGVMDAKPLLATIAEIFAEHRLEAVMVGNAAAALHGAPVTTLDVDFMFRKTPTNLKKLKAIARSLDASILKPYYPASDLFRVINDDRGLQLDFMAKIDGVRSFESLRSRATAVAFGAYQLKIASLADVIKSKRAAGRSRDLAVLEVLEKTLYEQENIHDEKGSADRTPKGE
jgi:predicted nucleotidyltransferase